MCAALISIYLMSLIAVQFNEILQCISVAIVFFLYQNTSLLNDCICYSSCRHRSPWQPTALQCGNLCKEKLTKRRSWQINSCSFGIFASKTVARVGWIRYGGYRLQYGIRFWYSSLKNKIRNYIGETGKRSDTAEPCFIPLLLTLMQ